MTRVRILHIELEGNPAETLQLVRDALLGGPTMTAELVALEAPVVRALPTPPVADESAGRSRPASTSRNSAEKLKSGAPKPAPKKGRGGSDARIQQLLDQGKTVQEVAAAVGLSAATVYARRKKLQEAEGPPTKGRDKGKDTPEAPKVRCVHCGQKGTDPTRCDHCGEKR